MKSKVAWKCFQARTNPCLLISDVPRTGSNFAVFLIPLYLLFQLHPKDFALRHWLSAMPLTDIDIVWTSLALTNRPSALTPNPLTVTHNLQRTRPRLFMLKTYAWKCMEKPLIQTLKLPIARVRILLIQPSLKKYFPILRLPT